MSSNNVQFVGQLHRAYANYLELIQIANMKESQQEVKKDEDPFKMFGVIASPANVKPTKSTTFDKLCKSAGLSQEELIKSVLVSQHVCQTAPKWGAFLASIRIRLQWTEITSAMPLRLCSNPTGLTLLFTRHAYMFNRQNWKCATSRASRLVDLAALVDTDMFAPISMSIKDSGFHFRIPFTIEPSVDEQTAFNNEVVLDGGRVWIPEHVANDDHWKKQIENAKQAISNWSLARAHVDRTVSPTRILLDFYDDKKRCHVIEAYNKQAVEKVALPAWKTVLSSLAEESSTIASSANSSGVSMLDVEPALSNNNDKDLEADTPASKKRKAEDAEEVARK